MTAQDEATTLLMQWQSQRHLAPEERILDAVRDAMQEPRRVWDDTEQHWLIWDETNETWRVE